MKKKNTQQNKTKTNPAPKKKNGKGCGKPAPEVVLKSPQTVIPETNLKGRPSKYSQALAAKVCAELSLGYSLRTVCRPDSMPSVVTIFSWFTKYPEFLKQYEKSKQEAADAMAEDILDISDDGTNDYMEIERQDGSIKEVVNSEHIQRSKLRVDTRKWLMSKMKPKKYGDKLDLTSDGKKLPTPIYAGKSNTK